MLWALQYGAGMKHACQSGFKHVGPGEANDSTAERRHRLKGQGGVRKANGHSELCDHLLGLSMDTGE